MHPKRDFNDIRDLEAWRIRGRLSRRPSFDPNKYEDNVWYTYHLERDENGNIRMVYNQ